MALPRSAPSSLRRRYWLFAGMVLAIAAFNLTFRLAHEIVVEWDESLYGLSAWEMVTSHRWLGTTFKGVLDYYNTKPPLNIWLISLSFKAFGPSLISLRLPSILSAWLTVLVLQEWARRAIGPGVALLASLVLATSFGFLYDHAGRNANTDALFALLVLLTMVTLWASQDHAWHLVWLGPIATAAFLLRGMGVLMPLAIVWSVEMARLPQWRRRWLQWVVAAALFTLPVGTWVLARWRLDQWQFLGPLFTYDFIARSFSVIEGHRGPFYYHLNVLVKNQPASLATAAAAWLLFPIPWSQLRSAWAFWRSDNPVHLTVGAWVAVTFLMPILIRTKLSWYLNPFYPAFALGVAWLVMRGWENRGTAIYKRRVLTTILILALCVAETRLVWYPVHRRNIAGSTQGFLLAARPNLKGHRVFRNHWDNSEVFLLSALVGAEPRDAMTAEDFLQVGAPGDYWVAREEVADSHLVLVHVQGRHWLYRRTE